MEGAFTHTPNNLVGDSASAINEGDDLSTLDAGESALDGEYGRGNLNGGPRRRRVGDDDETDVFDDDDLESLASHALNGKGAGAGVGGEGQGGQEEEVELPPHACSYCGIHNPGSVVKCLACSKWFCSARGNTIFLAHHQPSRPRPAQGSPAPPFLTLSETPRSNATTAAPRTSSCSALFQPSRTQSLFCYAVSHAPRMPSSKDMNWDTSRWQPLIEDRSFLALACQSAHRSRTAACAPPQPSNDRKLEEMWKDNASATLPIAIWKRLLASMMNRSSTYSATTMHINTRTSLDPSLRLRRTMIASSRKRSRRTISSSAGILVSTTSILLAFPYQSSSWVMSS